jgi:hypothetical protein
MNDKTPSDLFWYTNPGILWQSNRVAEFFPSADYTLEEKLNAIMRLSIYISILICLYHNDLRFVLIAVIAGMFTYHIHTFKPKDGDNREKFDDKIQENCTRPTLDNPFMNVTMKDYLNVEDNKIVDRPPACDASDPEIKKEMDIAFNNNLFRDVNDVFGKMNSQREFFTMPWTEIPNRQGDFADWLYKSPKTCKEDQDYCVRYEDVRSKRPVVGDPTQNPVNTKRLE